MAKASIIEIFRTVGLFIKYGGYARLPGLFEDEKMPQQKKRFFNVYLPFINFILQIFCASSCAYFAFVNSFERNLTDLLVCLALIALSFWFFICPIVFYFQVGKRMATFFKFHNRIDPLLKPFNRNLKRFVDVSFIICNVIFVLCYGSMAYSRYYQLVLNVEDEEWYFKYVLLLMMATVILGLYVMETNQCQPQYLYIVFHHILRSSFDELAKQIRSEKGKNLKTEEAVERIRYYADLHLSLCKLSKSLDHLLSPLMLFRYMVSLCTIIMCNAFITIPLVDTLQLGMIIISLIQMLIVALPAIYAQSTTNSALKVVSAIFLTFDSSDPKINAEVYTFSLQCFFVKKKFSASGYFNLNGELIMKILETIISYSVLFNRIYTTGN